MEKLKLFNKIYGKDFLSLKDMIRSRPESIRYITDYTAEDVLVFLEAATVKKVATEIVESVIMTTIRKFPDLIGNDAFINALVYYPSILDSIQKNERAFADRLFIRVLYRRQVQGSNSVELLSYIDKPSNRMKVFSIRFEPSSIQYLVNEPARRLKKFADDAIEIDSTSIRFIKNPTLDQKKKAVLSKVENLKYIQNQDGIASIAFSIDYESIQYIKPEFRSENMISKYIANEKIRSWSWISIDNFLEYNFSSLEIKDMVEYSNSKKVLSIIYLHYVNKMLELPNDLVEILKSKLEEEGEN